MRLMQNLGRLFGANPAGVVFAAMLLVAAAPFGVMHATLVPPGQAADEQAHAFRAFSLGHGELTGHLVMTTFPDGVTVPVTTVEIDPMVGAIMLAFGTGGAKVLNLHDLVISNYSPWSHTRVPAQIGIIGSYFPVFYVPSAAVMAVAESLRMVPMAAIQAGRFLNLGCFLVLGMAALLVARRGRAVFLCVLSVPMTVSLAASLNIDGLLIPTAVLAAALLTRDDAKPAAGRSWPGRSWRLAAVALAGIAMAKPPFLPLLAALLLPLPARRDWPALRRAFTTRLVLVALLAVPVLGWSAYIARFVLGVAHRDAYVAGPWWPVPGQIFHGTDAAAQFAVLIAAPARVLQLLYSSIDSNNIFRMMVGILGWLDLQLPGWLYGLWGAAVVVAVLSEMVGGRGSNRGLRLWDTLLLAAVLAATLIAIVLSQYLSWTPVGNNSVEGVQGRYLLPLVPFVALILPRIGVPGGILARGLGMVAPTAAAIAGSVAMPFLFLYIYYLR